MKHPIPDAVFEQHVAILGKTRSGKSSVMRLLVERLFELGMPVCIVDPKGDWWGVKLAQDGKSPGYPVVIFGGPHADVPINEHAGTHVAELFAAGNRPCLIDLKGWMVGERTRFWIDFASMLFKLTKGMRWLVVDEFHNFAPKGKIMDPSAGKALHWSNRLASEGLGMGLHMIFASQRPQKVHNDALTSAETLIAMRVLHTSDRNAIADWIDGCGDKKIGVKVLDGLAQLARGQGWVWSPEIGLGPEIIKFPLFKTYDSFRPQTADDAASLKGWATVDLEEVKAKLAAVVKEAEANDPGVLKRRIAEIEREFAAAKDAWHKGTSSTPADVEAATARGYRIGYADATHKAEQAVALHQQAWQTMLPALDRLVAANQALLEAAKRLREEMPTGPEKVEIIPAFRPPLPAAVVAAISGPSKPMTTVRTGNGSTTDMPSSARKMLAVMDTNPPVRRSWTQVATLAGLKARGGHYNSGKKWLADSGLVVEEGGLVSVARPSADATAAMSDPHELVRTWCASLSGAAPAILRCLFEMTAHGRASKGHIAELLNLQPRGGHWNTAWKELRDNDIVRVEGENVWLTELFQR